MLILKQFNGQTYCLPKRPYFLLNPVIGVCEDLDKTLELRNRSIIYLPFLPSGYWCKLSFHHIVTGSTVTALRLGYY